LGGLAVRPVGMGFVSCALAFAGCGGNEVSSTTTSTTTETETYVVPVDPHNPRESGIRAGKAILTDVILDTVRDAIEEAVLDEDVTGLTVRTSIPNGELTVNCTADPSSRFTQHCRGKLNDTMGAEELFSFSVVCSEVASSCRWAAE
jgi:hypothetical protein